MDSGMISLKPLYDWIKKSDKNGEGLEGTSDKGKHYSKIAKDITKNINKAAGFYLWGAYNKKGFWVNIYLGESGRSESGTLWYRIKYELTSERQFAWRVILPEEVICNASVGIGHFPKFC